mgnify:CR=1 FL=1
MKFTLSWLNQFTATGSLTPAQIADRLTMLGLEVDSVEELFADLDQIVTARVTAVSKHPDADKLTVCEVDDGNGSIQVVCGAPNVRAGTVSAPAPARGQPAGATEQALQELRRFAERAGLYGRQQ